MVTIPRAISATEATWEARGLECFELDPIFAQWAIFSISRGGDRVCVKLIFTFSVVLEHIDGALSDGDHGEGRNGRRYRPRGQRTGGASNLSATNTSTS